MTGVIFFNLIAPFIVFLVGKTLIMSATLRIAFNHVEHRHLDLPPPCDQLKVHACGIFSIIIFCMAISIAGSTVNYVYGAFIFAALIIGILAGVKKFTFNSLKEKPGNIMIYTSYTIAHGFGTAAVFLGLTLLVD